MDLNGGTPASIRLFALYQGAVAGICMLGVSERPLTCIALAAGHAVTAAVLLRWSARLTPRRSLRGRWLAAPYLLWVGSWLELGWIIRWTGGAPHDPGVVAADLALFGGHGHLLLAHWTPAAVSLMQATYLSYYALVLGPALILAWRGRRAACARYTHGLMATYLVCFAVYLVFPVLGPRAAAAAAGGGPASGAGHAGVLAGLEALLRSLGDSPGTAFPSSHCAGAWAAAMAAGARAKSGLRPALLLWAALITLSTVHTGNHYGVDAAAGLLTALAVRWVLVCSGTRRPFSLRREVLS